MSLSRRSAFWSGAAVVALGAMYVFACAPTTSGAGAGAAADAPARVYVAPGTHDEFFAFMSGGFSGQIGLYGLPS